MTDNTMDTVKKRGWLGFVYGV